MLNVPSEIEGKEATYGDVLKGFEKEGFYLCGGWEYDSAYFDSILHQDGEVTIYLRLPVQVVQGKLDDPDANMKFGQPFVIKHVIHTGIVENEDDATIPNLAGMNQFHKPSDPDDRIEDEARWKTAGEQALNRILAYVQ